MATKDNKGLLIEKSQDGINDVCPKCKTDGSFIYDEVMDSDVCSICGYVFVPITLQKEGKRE